jgi:cytosine/adenosine deaminase-related metal-dependent hydrolase/ubiquinone/menaquinone biosynthesis C-methylase UbiE
MSRFITAPRPTTRVTPREGYRLWSRTYDSTTNPVLGLEQRIVGALLPRVQDADVVDVGCGTGRWLEQLADLKPRTLRGIDSSKEMLARAKRKLRARAKLTVNSCEEWKPKPQSADVILGSFLLSYIDDLDSFAKTVRRALRTNGLVLFSDLHPATTRKLGWRRSFHYAGTTIEIATHNRPLDEIISAFEAAGLSVCAQLEPCFGELDRLPFQRTGRERQWETLRAHPAIYVLGMRISHPHGVFLSPPGQSETLIAIHSGAVALGPSDARNVAVQLNGSRVASLCESGRLENQEPRSGAGALDLSGYLLFPGLINAHDHLEFALFPRLGRGGYRNFLEWANDIHSPDSPAVSQHRGVPRETRLRWGGLRNLLCGVTTVCHHNPYEESVFEKAFPVRVLREYGWAHSHAFGGNLAAKKRATPPGQPFILHLAEGIDTCSAEDLFRVIREFPLDAQSVLVHCLGLEASGWKLVRQSGAAVICCPSSNVFLFGRTLRYEELRALPSLVLGNDSPLTAKGDLLDEIQFAREHTGLSAEDLYTMVTRKAAEVLCLRNGEGAIGPGAVADFFSVPNKGLSPARTLAQISHRDVELVVVGGRVQLASQEVKNRLPGTFCEGLNPLRLDGEMRWVRENTSELFASASRALGESPSLSGRALGI